MKLEVFEYIDQVMAHIKNSSYDLDIVSRVITNHFKNIFEYKDYFLNVNSRVKSPGSVKEKILRNNLYLDYPSVGGLIDSLSDLIGIRIECRFIPDEEKVFNVLLEEFNIDAGSGFYRSSTSDNIYLKLDEKQPQYQKNGFEIYKIDGFYLDSDRKYNFELQIKSMVNTFWGDIEHRILYKNYSYLLSEQFIKNMMGSIKENLTLIDRQLRVVYNHVFSLEKTSESSVTQIKEVLQKVIYDMYFIQIRDQLGFVVDFKSIVELIVDYVFLSGNGKGEVQIGKDFLKILNRLANSNVINDRFDEQINLLYHPTFEDEYKKKLCDQLINSMNIDFKWNLLFRIVFEVEDGPDEIIFEKFVIYLYKQFERISVESTKDSRFPEEEISEIQKFILEATVDNFIRDPDVESLDEKSLKKIVNRLNAYVLGMPSLDEWERHKSMIEDILYNISLEK